MSDFIWYIPAMVTSSSKENLVEMVETALKARVDGVGIFQWPLRAPEKDFLNLVRNMGPVPVPQHTDSYPANALFLFTSTLFADNSTTQFGRVSNPNYFKKYYWLFDPYKVVQSGPEETKRAAIDYIRPGYNVTAVPDWHHNAKVLIDEYSADFRNVLFSQDSDAPKALDFLVGSGPKSTIEGIRRYGPKLSRLLLLWMDYYGIHPLQRINEIGIQVDFNIMALAVQNRVIEIDGPTHKDFVIPLLHEMFTEAVKEKGWKAYDVSETLWWIGHKLCSNLRHDICPFSESCNRLISRKPMDSDGVVDPTDVGRRFSNRAARDGEERRLIEISNGQLTLID